MSKDLGEIREQEEQRDEMLYQQAAALQQAKKEEQAEKKRKAEEEGLSLPIEMLAFKASLQKTQTVLAALEQECEKITLGEDDGLKQECKEKLEEVKKRLNEQERAVLAWQEQGNKDMAENQNSAEALHRLRTKMAEDIKEYHTKGTEVSNVKQAMSSLRKWMASSKKAINDREKAALKTKASKAIASGGNSGPLAMLSESLAVSLKDLSTCGQVDYSFSETGVVKKMMPVLLDSTRGANLVKTCKGMEYYTMQKAWVGEKMKASNTRACNAVVSKKPIHGKLLEVTRKSFPECFQGEGFTGLPEDLKDHFCLQFGQRAVGKAGLALRTEFNAPSLVVALEGEMLVGGFRASKFENKGLVEERKKLEKSTANEVRALAQASGWVVKLCPGTSLVVPPDTIWFEYAEQECHTLRLLLDRQSMTAPMAAWLKQMQKEDPTGFTDRLKKLLEYLQADAPAGESLTDI